MIVTAKQTKSSTTPAPQRINAGRRGTASGETSFARANTFPKSVRLLKHASFQHVYERGRKQFSTSMIFFYVLKSSDTLKPGTQSVLSNPTTPGTSSTEAAPPLSPAVGDRVGTTSGQSSVQVGITVGRALGGAVDRNRIKRRIRDCVRHNLSALREALAARRISAEIVINPKKTVLTADIAKLSEEIARGFAVIAAANLPSANQAPGASRAR